MQVRFGKKLFFLQEMLLLFLILKETLIKKATKKTYLSHGFAAPRRYDTGNKTSGGSCRVQTNKELMPVDKEQTNLTSVHSGNKYGKSRNGGLS